MTIDKKTITLSDGRIVHLVDTGCGFNPTSHFVWLGQYGTEFAVVLGDSEDMACEYFADHIAYSALSNEHVSELMEELKADNGTLFDERAWEQATEGMLGLNGGAGWIDADEWGFWSPSEHDRKLLTAATKQVRQDSFAQSHNQLTKEKHHDLSRGVKYDTI